ncbi:MAG: TIGR04211 family SH3 domain-containing protein [Nitrospiraceae bacterium]|nr:MAG: TIGR04211 family SH3 domain-containing protein [Nitrospiraceae bacterium]
MRINRIIRFKEIIFSLMILPITVSIGIVCADTQYVSDQLIITLREGKGNEYKIIKTLKAGTPLEIIEESEHYLKVRTESGSEGWVLKQYITRETPKPVIIAGLEKEIARLNTKIEQYKKDKESLQDELKTARSDHNSKIRDLQQNASESQGKAEQTSRDLKDVSEKYNALLNSAKDVVLLVNERDNIKASNIELQTKTEQLQKENDELKHSQMIWWFGAGGGVFFVGWIVGKISRQKRFY